MVLADSSNNHHIAQVEPEPSADETMEVGVAASAGDTATRDLDKTDIASREDGTPANSEEPPLKANLGRWFLSNRGILHTWEQECM